MPATTGTTGPGSETALPKSHWPVVEMFGTAAEAFCENLFESAASALRDNEAPTFPFARIADRCVRKRLASELMMSGGAVEPGWIVMFQTVAGVKVNAAFLEAAGRFGGLSLEDPVRRNLDEESMPRCIGRFLLAPDATLHYFRRRAFRTYPLALQLAILEAHAVGPRSRVSAAWAVLDAIDAGRRLLPDLCTFLRVGKGAVRASRVLTGDAWSLSGGWSKARCLARFLAAMPPETRPDRIEVGSCHATELRILCVIVGRRLLARHHSSPSMEKTCEMLSELLDLPKRKAIACLRRHRRIVRREGIKEWLALTGEAGTLVRIGVVRPVTTPSGWRACPLRSKTELVIEGSEMNNCVASLTGDVRERALVVFSLQSSRFDERLTMVVTDAERAIARGWMAADRENGDEPAFEGHTLTVRLVGPSNSPPTYAGVRGAMEVLETLWPHKAVVQITAS